MYEPYQNQPQEKKSNGVSIASFVCGLVSLCCCNPMYLVSLAAVILGIVGITQKNNPNKGMAIAGIIIAAVGVVLSIVITILSLSTGVLVDLFGASTATTPSYYYYY